MKAWFERRRRPHWAAGIPQDVVSSEALRQAALQASWRRDHRVGKRRQVLRWALFWAGKYAPAAALVIGIATMLVLTTLEFTTLQSRLPVPSPTAVRPPPTPPVMVPIDNTVSARNTLEWQLGAYPNAATKTNDASDPGDTTPQPLLLKPEHQLAPKESPR